jgi:AAA+ ATPase superfamily predicted ATPase
VRSMPADTSPFTPGIPVPVELFVGRKSQIEEILQYVERSKKGKQENIFLTGERGIGKSSLAKYIHEIATIKENYLSIHVLLGGVNSVDGVIFKIFDAILKESYKDKENWGEKIKDFFGKYIAEVGLFGVSVAFKPQQENLRDLKNNFTESLMNVIERIPKTKSGLFIVLDDINGLAKTDEFANWYKSFVDHIATHYTKCPITILIIGLPEVRDALSIHQESLMRIFRVVNIEKLSNAEVRDFFLRAFETVHTSVDDDANDMHVIYSSGLPILMHEIGDSVFRKNTDTRIDRADASSGIVSAANIIGEKYLNPKVYHAIRSERYKSILTKIGKNFSFRFRKSEIEKTLNESEKRVINNFLRTMREKGVIVRDPDGARGSYQFVNELYALYITMMSAEKTGSHLVK